MRAPVQIAFMTGQSDRASCALSPIQEAFLDALPLLATSRVRLNFPYDTSLRPRTGTPLWRASWSNARQYFESRRPDFAERYRAPVMAMLDQADYTVLLAGSCGLELFANLHLPGSALDRVRVFAYGSVARHRPACGTMAICGRRDLIARPWRRPGDIEVDCGHMTYLEAPEVLALCSEFLVGMRSAMEVAW